MDYLADSTKLLAAYESVPPIFSLAWARGLQLGFENGVRRAREDNVPEEYEPYHIGSTRHFLVHRDVKATLLENGIEAKIDKNSPKGYPFLEAVSGRISVVLAREPRSLSKAEAEFLVNRRHQNVSFFDFDEWVNIPELGRLKCELVYDVARGHPDKISYAIMALKLPDGNIASFDFLAYVANLPKQNIILDLPNRSTPPEPEVEFRDEDEEGNEEQGT